MGLECVENNGRLRFTWICDRCGEEITDIRSGHVDYNSWKPLPDDPEQKTRTLNKRFEAQRVYTFHKECAPAQSAGIYWSYIQDAVWDLMLPEDRRTSKSSLAERARDRARWGL